MTISEIGDRYKQKYLPSSSKPAFEVGIEVLRQHPTYWERVDSGITRQIHDKIEALNVNDSGFIAKFRKWGAQKKAEYYQALTNQLLSYNALRAAELEARRIDNLAQEFDKTLDHENAVADITRKSVELTAAESLRSLESTQPLRRRNEVNALEAENKRLYEATQRNMTPEAYDQFVLETAKKEEMDRLERVNRELGKKIDVNAAYDIDERENIKRHRTLQKLKSAYEEAYGIKTNADLPHEVRARQLAATEAFILKLEKEVGFVITVGKVDSGQDV